MFRFTRGLLFLVALTALGGPALTRAGLADADRQAMAEAQSALAAGDYSAAFKLFSRLASEQNIPLAQFTLGLFYDLGWARSVDRSRACQWYQHAAQGGVPVAQHRYGDCLVEGALRPPDAPQALDWYQQAADAGHTISLCAMAALYMRGQGVAKNAARGLAYCHQAAVAGLPVAQLQTGRYLLEGDEAIRDIDAAAVWLRQAADAGLPEAAYYLGVLNSDYLQPAGEFIHWFEQAASQGYLPAYYPAAEAYFRALSLATTDHPPAATLAKAYLWLSATALAGAEADQRNSAREMLSQVMMIMPESWQPQLDQDVAEHFQRYPQNRRPDQ